LILRSLVEMGYQCFVGILQAGQYGVPQTRRRAFVMAAAPGEVLPFLPEPLHVFPKGKEMRSFRILGKEFKNLTRSEAPFRHCTVRDALSDLPKISSGASSTVISYAGGGEGESGCTSTTTMRVSSSSSSHYQRKLRSKLKEPVVYDHI